MAMSEASVAGVAIDTRHWIGGRRVASPGTFTDLSPIDEQPLAEIARGGGAEVTQAVQAARDAFPGWAATAPADRAAVLRAIAGAEDKPSAVSDSAPPARPSEVPAGAPPARRTARKARRMGQQHG